MELSRIFVVANAYKPHALQALADLKVWCRERGIEAIAVEDPVPKDAEGAIVLALGGDGTVLRAASLFQATAIPILGINVGSLGFLTQAPLDGLIGALEQVIDDAFGVEERMRLRYDGPGLEGSVLNDIVVTGADSTGFCELAMRWGDGHVAAYPGDGLIVATATGSTAYSLSAGGPVIVPPAACILATPHASHRLGLRPIVFPPEEVLHVTAHSAVRLIADGDLMGRIEAEREVVIRRFDVPTRLVRLRGATSFFGVLNEKLNWPGG